MADSIIKHVSVRVNERNEKGRRKETDDIVATFQRTPVIMKSFFSFGVVLQLPGVSFRRFGERRSPVRQKDWDETMVAAAAARSGVGLEDGAAEGADDGLPGAGVEGDAAEASRRFHVCNPCSCSAPRAGSRRRLAALHRPPLVYQEAEEDHRFFPPEFFCRSRPAPSYIEG